MKLFDSIKGNAPKRNKFDLSHERKFSLDMGKLVPIMCEEILPGDKFRVNTEMLIRFAPLLAPMMHRVNIYTHYWFVPNRLLWNEWEDFITGGKDGTLAPTPPYLVYGKSYDANDWFTAGSLADYMGIPTAQPGLSPTINERINALPFRAYQLIYSEFFRDQNLSDPIDFAKTGGEISDATPGAENEGRKLLTMRDRAWEKDYFTSCLPWAQRGGEVITPFAGSPDVIYGTPKEYSGASAGGRTIIRGAGAGAIPPDGALATQAGDMYAGTTGAIQARVENIYDIDMTSTGVTVNDLRKSVRLQEWLERNARGGARYVEQILNHFGVRLDDYRAQRPIFLGGGKQPVVVSEVLSNFQFSGDAEGQPQGHMAGHGISVGNQNGFKHSFNEHGYVIGVMSVLPKTAYSQGIQRMWSKTNKFDFAFPEFANIGEQEVRNKELFLKVDGAEASQMDQTFGYQSRYAEYKYKPSSIHGAFRTSLNYWHMGREFTTLPQLNENFVMSDPTKRIYAVPSTEETLYCQIYHKVDALRPLPYYGTPRL